LNWAEHERIVVACIDKDNKRKKMWAIISNKANPQPTQFIFAEV